MLLGLLLSCLLCLVLVVVSVTEKEALVTSLQEELREVREKLSSDAVRLSLHTDGLIS